ncbi:FHA domain-containing protein [Luteimonas sp. MJ174]|uniref:FHA domain-containing protein n=1 Tax=Luteimonas sp. MJ174 TaxID=3129237 RepID=UPI0031BA1F9E
MGGTGKGRDTEAPEDRGIVLRVVSGLHAGAERDLAGGEMILIGSGEDCDMVLADAGVAARHALLSFIDGRFSLRALDAPLHVGAAMVHPGDPVELGRVQRVGIGEAAIAFGAADDGGWERLVPGGFGPRAAPEPANRPWLRRLPAVAAVAVLSLVSLAIFATVMPQREQAPDPREQLQRLVPEYGIDGGQAATDLQGRLVLSGTVPDAATRERIARRIADDGIDARLELRTGDDIAGDVAEILRGQGISAHTRYLGNGDVEVRGAFEDEAALQAASFSRAMREVNGVVRVIPVNVSERAVASRRQPVAPAAPARIRVAAIVRGDDPHVVSGKGDRYLVGAELPGIGTLVSITDNSAHVLLPDGNLERLKVEAAAKGDEREAEDFSNVRSDARPMRM